MNPDILLAPVKLDSKVKDKGTTEDLKFVNQTKDDNEMGMVGFLKTRLDKFIQNLINHVEKITLVTQLLESVRVVSSTGQ